MILFSRIACIIYVLRFALLFAFWIAFQWWTEAPLCVPFVRRVPWLLNYSFVPSSVGGIYNYRSKLRFEGEYYIWRGIWLSLCIFCESERESIPLHLAMDPPLKNRRVSRNRTGKHRLTKTVPFKLYDNKKKSVWPISLVSTRYDYDKLWLLFYEIN